MDDDHVNQTASVLIEALPYIQKFHGETIVIKYGGNAMVDEDLKQSFARDIVLMKLIGINPIVVHGGGPQINSFLEKLDIESKFIDGIRITDERTMEIVQMVLGGLVNKEIVTQLCSAGGKAIGITGKDGNLIKAKKLRLQSNDSGKDHVDVGLVGEIESVDTDILRNLMENNIIPVIAPIGVGDKGESYNINADTVAGKVAEYLNAEKLVLLTNTSGVLDESGQVLSVLSRDQVEELTQSKLISEGMIPKVECALSAIENGVNSVQIIDGRISHCLLLELFTDSGIGTQIVQTK
jgi:acetylglutamate kinase